MSGADRHEAACRVLRTGVPNDEQTISLVDEIFAQTFGSYVKGPAQLVHGSSDEGDYIRVMRARRDPRTPRGRVFGRRFVWYSSRIGVRILSAEEYRQVQDDPAVVAYNSPFAGGTVAQRGVAADVLLHEVIHGWTNSLYREWYRRVPDGAPSGKAFNEAATDYLTYQTCVSRSAGDWAYAAGEQHLRGLGLAPGLLERAMFGGEFKALEEALIAKTKAGNIQNVFYGFQQLEQHGAFSLPETR